MRKRVTIETRVIKSVSKSKLDIFDKCPLQAWKKERDTGHTSTHSRNLDIGVLAHELAAKAVAESVGINRVVSNLEERFPLDVIFQVQEDINFAKLLLNYGEDLTIIGVEESASLSIESMNNEFRINTRYDCLGRLTVKNQTYIVVDDFKTGFQLKTQVDTEALLYAYVAYKTYDLPVIFRRISLNSGKVWSKEFSIEGLKRIESSILLKIAKYKEEMESDYVPEHTPGSHCYYCPELMRCQGRKYIDTLNDKYKIALWAKEVAKFRETEVKSAAALLINEESIDGQILIPFLENGKYGAIASVSESYQLNGRKIKKSDIIRLLIETDEIEDFVDDIDIKFSPELANKLMSYNIPMKQVIRTSVKLVKDSEGGEDDDE